jgi:hypothetical protein
MEKRSQDKSELDSPAPRIISISLCANPIQIIGGCHKESLIDQRLNADVSSRRVQA